MPVQVNIAIENTGTIAWDGTTTYEADIRKHVRFGFSIEVKTDIAVDAVFNVEAAPASATNTCVPGTFAPVSEVATCVGGAVAAQATITIPAGTKAGTICGGALPCRPNAFVKLVPTTGDTGNVRIVHLRNGPKIY